MISKAYDWYRLVDPTPTSQVITDRTKTAEELLKQIEKIDPSTILALVEGSARGFTGSAAQTSTIEWLLRALKKNDPAISESLTQNKLELRFLASLIIGEVMTSSSGYGELGPLAAAAFVSGIGLRPMPNKRHLQLVLEELRTMAHSTLERAAISRRKRFDVSPVQEDEILIQNFQGASRLIGELKESIAQLNQNAEMDREEMNLFWFIASGYSKKRREAFAALPISVSAVHAALDVFESVLLPPTGSCLAILGNLVEAKRTSEDVGPTALSDHVAQWKETESMEIASASPELPMRFPAIFPLTWLACRLSQAKSIPSDSETRRTAELRMDLKIRAAQLACQLINERVAVKMASEFEE